MDEGRLRDHLVRIAAEVPPSEVPERLLSRVRRRIATVATLLTMLVVILAIGFTQVVATPDRAPVAGTAYLEIVEHIPLNAERPGEFVRDVAYGLGSVWALNARDATLQQIDPSTNEVASVIKLDDEVDYPAGYWDVEVGFDRVWVTDPAAKEVIGLDPVSQEIVARIANVGRPLTIFVANDALWIHSGGSADDEMLYRVDPATLEVTGSLGLGDECCLGGIAEADGYLWLSHSAIPDTPRVDAEGPRDMVFDLSNEVRKIDLDSLLVVDTIPLEGDTWSPPDSVLGDLISAHGYLWSTRTTDGYLDRIDPSSGRVESIQLKGLSLPSVLIDFEGSVWAWALNGSKTVPVDPMSLEVGAVSDMNEALDTGPVEGAGSLWSGSTSDPMGDPPNIVRIGPSGNLPDPVPSQPEETATPTPEEPEIEEGMTEQEEAEVFAFRAVARTGLMDPFGGRSYYFTFVDRATETNEGWRVGFAANDCSPRDQTFTCRGLSGEDPDSGNALIDTYVTVRSTDAQWQVVNVEGNMLEDERGLLVGYTLPRREERPHWEFPSVGIWRDDDLGMVTLVPLWVGPYPTSAPGSTCEVELFDADGDAVGEPWVFDQEAPSRPFDRGGWHLGRGLDDSPEATRATVHCRRLR